MKTLKEPQEPFCPPFPLPLSPLSRRPRVAFCAFNQQLFLSFFARFDDECFLSRLSLSLLQNNQKESPQRLIFSDQKAQKAPLSSTKILVERSLVRVFSFLCAAGPPDSWHPKG